MTAVEWPSLDKLLADATPVEPVPPLADASIVMFSEGMHTGIAYRRPNYGDDAWVTLSRDGEYDRIRVVLTPWLVDRHGYQLAPPLASVYDLEAARRIACSLEQENAHLTARATEAVGLLGDALLWCNDAYSNTADSISEAIAALRGAE